MVLGLDFGTHQTKVCLENDSDPRDIRYIFQEYEMPDGGHSYFIPSVVQVNCDDTVSYGFCDLSKAKEIGYEYLISKPEYQEVPIPDDIPIPREPFKKGIPPEDVFLNSYIQKKNKERRKKGKKPLTVESLNETQRQEAQAAYLRRIEEVERINRENQESWEGLRDRINAKNKANQEAYERTVIESKLNFEKETERWENSRRTKYATYRYFKIATFSREYSWNEDICAKQLSIWYITYLMFLIRNFSNISRIQMGIPQSVRDERTSSWQTQTAKDLYYGAWYLMKQTGSLENFLSLKVDELKSMTKTFGISKEEFPEAPGFLVLPEAFASLETITSQGKLKAGGLHLLVDIGGGSTDISLFYVNSKQKPNISAIVSVHKGLNYIFKLYQQNHLDLSIEQIRDSFNRDPEEFEQCIRQYFIEIGAAVQDNIFSPLCDVTLQANLSLQRLKEALMNRPVIYTGGGGVYSMFHRGVHYFQDPLSISKDLLTMRNISNKDITPSEMAILTVAYGLSIPQRRSPEMVPIDQLFNGVMGVNKSQSSPDYGVDDVD